MTGKMRLQVLLVDPDGSARAAVRHAVSTATVPIDLLETGTVAEGLQTLRSRTFDCVLLDWYLPDEESSAFLESLEQTAPDVPVIVLTGGERPGSPAGPALKEGAQDYLEKKGLDASGLVRSIRYAVARKRTGELKAQLLHADRLGTIGQLAAGVAHEVNNPATWVLGNLSLLRDQLADLGKQRVDPAEARASVSGMLELVDDCRRGMERIVDTVRNLKRYAQPSPPRDDLLDINAVVREAHRIARPETRHRAQIELVLRAVRPVRGDAGTLGQLVINLMINAAHALDDTPSSSHVIRVTTRSVGATEVQIAVEDSGPGVPSTLHDRIFEPFFTTRVHSDGSGMGLAICRDIVRRHRGRIAVGDSPLGGARFEVTLPCEEIDWDDMETRAIHRVRPSAKRKGEMRVLVIDDEPQILDVVTRLLPDCQVVTAGNGLEALKRLRADPGFDGVLCDLMMPDMDGAELIQTLAEELPEVTERVVLCTGGAVTPKLGEFLSSAPCLVLHKPFGQSDLAQVVDHWRDLRC